MPKSTSRAEPIRIKDRLRKKREETEGTGADRPGAARRRNETRPDATGTENGSTAAPGIKKPAETGPPRRFSRNHRQALAARVAEEPRGPAGQWAEKYPADLWEMVTEEYRAGQLPIAEISRIYGPSPATIVSRMKGAGIVRGDLAGKVRDRLRDKILTDGQAGAARGRPTETEEDRIAEEAARRAFKTVKLHQKTAATLRAYVDKIAKRVPKKEEMKDPKTLKILSEAVRNASFAFDKLVGIERRAFGIDDREAAAKRLKIELD